MAKCIDCDTQGTHSIDCVRIFPGSKNKTHGSFVLCTFCANVELSKQGREQIRPAKK